MSEEKASSDVRRSKVLWLCSICLPLISRERGEEPGVFGGWLAGLSEMIVADKRWDLVVCYPQYDSGDVQHEEFETVSTYTFPTHKKREVSNIDVFEDILAKERPDVIHIHGTERGYSRDMVIASKRVGLLERVCISIQGLVSVYAEHYFDGVPYEIAKARTATDIVLHRSMIDQRRNYQMRGISEHEAIATCKHVIGRTRWDRDCVQFINESAEYHCCNENLRASFYEGDEWLYSNCTPHTIFLSQWEPVYKGFLKLLEALPLVLARFPDTQVRVAGGGSPLRGRRSITGFARCVREVMKREGVTDKFTFLGVLNELQMKEEFLSANTFVCSSAIENSPNSLGEAMITGTPCVASYVGGIPDMLKDHDEGWLYPYNAAYSLAAAIIEVFSLGDAVSERTNRAMEHAKRTHAREDNLASTLDVYARVSKGSA